MIPKDPIKEAAKNLTTPSVDVEATLDAAEEYAVDAFLPIIEEEQTSIDGTVHPINRKKGRQLTYMEEVQILVLYKQGLTRREIGEQFNISESTVSRVINSDRMQDVSDMINKAYVDNMINSLVIHPSVIQEFVSLMGKELTNPKKVQKTNILNLMLAWNNLVNGTTKIAEIQRNTMEENDTEDNALERIAQAIENATKYPYDQDIDSKREESTSEGQ